MRQAIALISAAVLCAGLAQAGTVDVQFEQPDRYTDVGPRSDAAAVQAALRGILQTLAAERLPADQSLTLAITDIDLAGEIRPFPRHLQDVRVMGQSADWPRISLRYTLRDGSRVLAEGQEVVSDMAYLMRSTRVSSSDRLPYEQRMLSEWFDSRLVRQAH